MVDLTTITSSHTTRHARRHDDQAESTSESFVEQPRLPASAWRSGYLGPAWVPIGPTSPSGYASWAVAMHQGAAPAIEKLLGAKEGGGAPLRPLLLIGDASMAANRQLDLGPDEPLAPRQQQQLRQLDVLAVETPTST